MKGSALCYWTFFTLFSVRPSTPQEKNKKSFKSFYYPSILTKQIGKLPLYNFLSLIEILYCFAEDLAGPKSKNRNIFGQLSGLLFISVF